MGMGGNGNGNGFMEMGGNGNRNSPARTPLSATAFHMLRSHNCQTWRTHVTTSDDTPLKHTSTNPANGVPPPIAAKLCRVIGSTCSIL